MSVTNKLAGKAEEAWRLVSDMRRELNLLAQDEMVEAQGKSIGNGQQEERISALEKKLIAAVNEISILQQEMEKEQGRQAEAFGLSLEEKDAFPQ